MKFKIGGILKCHAYSRVYIPLQDSSFLDCMKRKLARDELYTFVRTETVVFNFYAIIR